MRWMVVGLVLACSAASYSGASARTLTTGTMELAADASGLTRIADHRAEFSATSLALVVRPGYFYTDQLELVGSLAFLQDEQVDTTSVKEKTWVGRVGVDYHLSIQDTRGLYPFVHGSYGYASTARTAGAAATATTFQGGTYALGVGAKFFLTETSAIRVMVSQEQFQGGSGRDVTSLSFGYAIFFGPESVRREETGRVQALESELAAARQAAAGQADRLREVSAKQQALENDLAAARQAALRDEASLARNRALEAELASLRDLVKDRDALAVRVRVLDALLAETPRPGAEVESLTAQLRDLQADLLKAKASIADQEAALKARREEALKESRGRVLFEERAETLFEAGHAEITPAGQKTLETVATALQGLEGRRIVVEGHTDNVPIKGKLQERFPTNWELSVTRAMNVVRYLEAHGVDPARLSAVGYGEHAPVASNDTPEGRARNRRIRILLVPAEQP